MKELDKPCCLKFHDKKVIEPKPKFPDFALNDLFQDGAGKVLGSHHSLGSTLQERLGPKQCWWLGPHLDQNSSVMHASCLLFKHKLTPGPPRWAWRVLRFFWFISFPSAATVNQSPVSAFRHNYLFSWPSEDRWLSLPRWLGLSWETDKHACVFPQYQILLNNNKFTWYSHLNNIHFPDNLPFIGNLAKANEDQVNAQPEKPIYAI